MGDMATEYRAQGKKQIATSLRGENQGIEHITNVISPYISVKKGVEQHTALIPL